MAVQIRFGSPNAAKLIAEHLKPMKQGDKLEVVAVSDNGITQDNIQSIFTLIHDSNLYANRKLEDLSLSYRNEGANKLIFYVPVGSPVAEYDRIIEVSKPCFEYYKQQVDEKDIYDYLLTELCKVYSPIQIPLAFKLSNEQCSKIVRAISYDHPEIWFMSFSPNYTITQISGNVNGIQINYIENVGRPKIASMDVQFRAKAKEIIIQVQKKQTPYERELCLYDLLTVGKKQEECENHQNAYGVIINGAGMSAGYTNAFKYFADHVGLEAIAVNGNKSTWNAVKLNGHFYNVMVIFGVLQNHQYSHLNIDDAHMIDFNRDILGGFELPTCEHMDEFYYNKTGNWVKGPVNLIPQQMQEIAKNQLQSGKNTLTFYIDPNAGASTGSIPSNSSIMDPLKQTISRVIHYNSIDFKWTETVLTMTVK